MRHTRPSLSPHTHTTPRWRERGGVHACRRGGKRVCVVRSASICAEIKTRSPLGERVLLRVELTRLCTGIRRYEGCMCSIRRVDVDAREGGASGAMRSERTCILPGGIPYRYPMHASHIYKNMRASIVHTCAAPHHALPHHASPHHACMRPHQNMRACVSTIKHASEFSPVLNLDHAWDPKTGHKEQSTGTQTANNRKTHQWCGRGPASSRGRP